MATLSHSESRKLYSWWWDSHISPKNSKWLQENLTDMDSKVKAMIRLIEEDADSFARRAEMYYKKRPELMKLVEEFYRAYRALAERYDHATVELRQAHRTMVKAFPDDVSYALANGSNSGLPGPNGEPHTPELPHPIRSLLEPGISSADLQDVGFSADSEGIPNRGLKQLGGMFGSGGVAAQISKFSDRMTNRVADGEMTKRVADGDMEFQFLMKVLSEIKAEKEAVVLQYQKSLQKLSALEKELRDAGGLDERASRAEIEIRVLKEALAKLEAERDASHLQLNKCFEKISSLENMISKSQEETNGLHERASKADVKAQNLMKELSGLVAEKEASLLQYNQCLEMIFILRNRISSAEENARWLDEQTEKAEAEIKALKQALSELNEEKDDVELQYEHCLERIAELESEISLAHENAERLNTEVMTGVAKLKNMEEQCDFLERSNQSLQLAAEDLVQKILIKDQKLSQKENELDRLQTLLKDEQSRFGQVEATLQALQRLHSQSQDKQTTLANELENKLLMLKDLETCKHSLQGDLQQAQEDNQCLTELNTSSSITVVNLQNEIRNLKQLKEKLEEDLALQVVQSNSLQEEICCLKEEIESLNERYQALLEQLHSVGLNPDAVAALVRNMQEENLKLKEVCKKDTDDKELLFEKLKELDKVQKMNVALEKSLSESNGKLEGSGEKIKELQGSCQLLQGEKSGLVSEKAILLSQLQMMTENMQKLFEKNALAENSLSLANIELEGLRAKSKSLEEFCQMLKDEKSSILNERNNLVAQLQNVELRLGNLEMRFSRLEEFCNDLENEKNSSLCQVKELQVFLGIEKQERASYVQSSEFRMADLERQVHVLQEERRLSKKEFEEELNKAVNAQVEIVVLQKFVEDLEHKNMSLLLECQKHVEASKLSNKLMAEFETENLEQQVEIEFLLDEIEKLRLGVHRVFKALQLGPVYELQDKCEEEEQIPFELMLENVKGLKFSLLKSEDEKQQLVVENLVLLALLKQLRIEGTEFDSVKKSLEKEFQIMTKQLTLLQKDKHELLEMNRQLNLAVANGEEQEEVLKGQLETQHLNVVNLQNSHQALQEEHFKVLEKNSSLLQKFSDLKENVGELEEDYNSVLQEAVTLGNLLLVFKHFRSKKGEELKLLYEDLSRLHSVSSDLRKKVEMLGQKLEIEEAESLKLNETIKKLHQKLHEGENLNDELNYQILIGKEFLREQSMELLEAQKKLEATKSLNAELCSTIEEMKRECEASKTTEKSMEMQIHELSEDCFNQQMEIECLHKTNEDMQSEVGILLLEVEEHRLNEENLTLELQEKSNEFELWENEASSFYFDLQTCSIRELMIENKVHDLTSACEHLEEMNAIKDIKIEEMKERLGFLESEIGGLKAQLSAYGPVIASLQGNVESLEQNVLQTKCLTVGSKRNLDVDVAFQTPEPNNGELTEDKSSVTKDGVSNLLEMQVRIKAVEKAITQQENWLTADNTTHIATGTDAFRMQETVNSYLKLGPPPIEEARLQELQGRLNGVKCFQKENHLGNKPLQNSNLQDKESEISVCRKAILTKDIPLDEISDRSSHRRSTRESTETESAEDKMFDLGGSGEFDYNADPRAKGTRKQGAALLKTRSRRRVHRAAKQKRGDPSVGVEKEVGVDKLEVLRNNTEELNQEGSRGKILERLESDAKKLISIQITVQELKRKMEMKKKSKKDKNLEIERVKRQLLEVDDMVLQLFGMTNQLARDIQQTISPEEKNTLIDLEEAVRKRVTEQACTGSEKIGRLQFKVESIRYSLLKLEDEKKSKGAHGFTGSKTGILLRDFIYIGSRRNSRKGKKTCICGCGRPLTHED